MSASDVARDRQRWAVPARQGHPPATGEAEIEGGQHVPCSSGGTTQSARQACAPAACCPP